MGRFPSGRRPSRLAAFPEGERAPCAAGQAFRPLALLPGQARCHKGKRMPSGPLRRPRAWPGPCKASRPWGFLHSRTSALHSPRRTSVPRN